jgi:tRNA U34 5-methylaminomethyl-2-thiouridine-forming methyltransferase MnmC
MIKERISPLLGRDDVYVVASRDGSNTLFSREYGATYHSIYGAVSESKHTYIQRCLHTQLNRKEINILEFGFGTGLNAFLAFLTAESYKKQINYTGFEAYPLDLNIVSQLEYSGYLACHEKEAVFMRMHETNAFTENYFQFQRLDYWDIIKLEGPFDCIFFDAFAPESQPELWQQEMFDLLFKVTSPGGCLSTYCAKGEVRRRIAQSGYVVERIPGAPGKRQMLQAFKSV